MKQIFILLLPIAWLQQSCSNDNAVSAAPTENVITATETNARNTENALKRSKEEKEKKVEELKKLHPISADQLKKLFPKQINGIKQRNLDAHSALGYAMASCEYKKDSTFLSIHISDCTGEVGATQYALNYWAKLNVPEETENGYTRTIDLNGSKAVESFDKSNQQLNLTFFTEGRLLVMLSGKNITIEQLKTEAQKMTFKL